MRNISPVVKDDDIEKKKHTHSVSDISDFPEIPDETAISGMGFTKNSGDYSKPNGGIPKSDLASAVQTSLSKADTALQEHQSLAEYVKADDARLTDARPANGGNAETVNGHTINADVPANAVFTDTTYEPATTSSDGLMSAADKTKLDETRLWRRCVVGQSTDTITNPYYKFASISLSDAYYDAAITFKVSLNYGDRSTYLGILTAHVRTSGTAYWEGSELVWEYALSGIDTTKFILCYNTSTKPTIAELWVKVDRGWSLYHFDVLTEGTRTTSNNSLWTLYNKSSAGSEAALPSGYVQQTSTLGMIKNSISGNAATATNASKVNNHSVESDVPSNAKFTDTTYSNATTSAAGLMSAADKAKLDDMSSSSVAAVKAKFTSFKSNFEIL